MDIDDDIEGQLRLGHLLLNDRRCRSCGQIKNLIDGYYRTRKNRGSVASSYSYECKECSIKRIINKRKQKDSHIEWEYPNW
jgi:ferredoxin-like protein FixX